MSELLLCDMKESRGTPLLWGHEEHWNLVAVKVTEVGGDCVRKGWKCKEMGTASSICGKSTRGRRFKTACMDSRSSPLLCWLLHFLAMRSRRTALLSPGDVAEGPVL